MGCLSPINLCYTKLRPITFAFSILSLTLNPFLKVLITHSHMILPPFHPPVCLRTGQNKKIYKLWELRSCCEYFRARLNVILIQLM